MHIFYVSYCETETHVLVGFFWYVWWIFWYYGLKLKNCSVVWHKIEIVPCFGVSLQILSVLWDKIKKMFVCIYFICRSVRQRHMGSLVSVVCLVDHLELWLKFKQLFSGMA